MLLVQINKRFSSYTRFIVHKYTFVRSDTLVTQVNDSRKLNITTKGNNSSDFHLKVLSTIPLKFQKYWNIVGILKNIVIHHHQSNFYWQNNSNQTFEAFFFIFVLFLCLRSSAFSTCFFYASVILALKFIFVILSTSWVTVNVLVSGIFEQHIQPIF